MYRLHAHQRSLVHFGRAHTSIHLLGLGQCRYGCHTYLICEGIAIRAPKESGRTRTLEDEIGSGSGSNDLQELSDMLSILKHCSKYDAEWWYNHIQESGLKVLWIHFS
jgi:hypothetical protein